MPEFLVIAGANGAGKSSFSAVLGPPNALIFDPDIQKLKIERAFPDISEEAVQEELTRKYRNFEIKALGNHLSLTVETNLRNDFLAERATFFKERKYRTALVFILLPTLGESVMRVQHRVANKGHFVDMESIRLNYSESLKNLYRLAPIFDEVVLLHNAISQHLITQPQMIAQFRERELIWQNPECPEWALEVTKSVQASLDDNELRLTNQQERPKSPKR